MTTISSKTKTIIKEWERQGCLPTSRLLLKNIRKLLWGVNNSPSFVTFQFSTQVVAGKTEDDSTCQYKKLTGKIRLLFTCHTLCLTSAVSSPTFSLSFSIILLFLVDCKVRLSIWKRNTINRLTEWTRQTHECMYIVFHIMMMMIILMTATTHVSHLS